MKRLFWCSLGALCLTSVEAAAQNEITEPVAPTESTIADSVPRSSGAGTQEPVNFESHLGSSSHSKSDINQGDSFDLARDESRSSVVRGGKNAPGILPEEAQGNTGIHVVQTGDTLSKISQQAYGQPWMWPKLWSLNPQIQNPHWIYPGDQIRLTASGTAASPREVRTLGAGPVALQQPAGGDDSVFLRQLGYIDDPAKGIKGEIVGAVEPVQLMAEAQHVYIVLKPSEKVSVGQTLTVFREVRDPPKVKDSRTPPGKLVALQGAVQIEYVNLKTRVARARVVESLDVIERGAKVGFVEHEHRIVAPTRVNKNVTARVLTSMHPHVMMGQHQVVFIDRGQQDGLAPGNRLFITRRGDTWRRTLITTTHFARSRLNMDSDQPNDVDAVPLHGNEQDFPEEVVAELRIVRAHKFSALAVVTESKVEVVPGDRAIARAGF